MTCSYCIKRIHFWSRCVVVPHFFRADEAWHLRCFLLWTATRLSILEKQAKAAAALAEKDEG